MAKYAAAKIGTTVIKREYEMLNTLSEERPDAKLSVVSIGSLCFLFIKRKYIVLNTNVEYKGKINEKDKFILPLPKSIIVNHAPIKARTTFIIKRIFQD